MRTRYVDRSDYGMKACLRFTRRKFRRGNPRCSSVGREDAAKPTLGVGRQVLVGGSIPSIVATTTVVIGSQLTMYATMVRLPI